MRTKSYVIVSAGLAAGLLTFLISLVFASGAKDPLPPQNATVQVTTAAPSAVAPSTSIEAAEEHTTGLLAARILDEAAARLLPSSERPLEVGCGEPTVLTAPSADLASIVAGSEPGTCFVLEAGEYQFQNVVPKDYMTFLGVDRGAVVVRGSQQAENAFHGTATGVTIGRMTLTGFQGSAGEKRQEQGAIRGTSAIWKSDRGEMARDWLIQDVEASNNYATGIFLGDHFTVRGGMFAGNGISGIGGSETVGGLIEENVITGNGFEQASGYLANGAGMKFVQAASPDDPLVIRRNEIYGNSGIGVWCDIGCDGFEVVENYIHDERSRAVMYELSSNAVIRDNLVVNANSWTDYNRDFNAGAITVGESRDVVVEDNYIDGALSGVIIRQTRRPVQPQESFLFDYTNVTFVSERVNVRNNVLVNTGAMGISLGSTGRGLIPDLSSIRFEGNTYADPRGITFWWNGQRFDFDEWRASGRDVAGDSSVPARPAWSLGS